jgi:uncharacterized membrane protein YphA (DoxX/SURF4 family)
MRLAIKEISLPPRWFARLFATSPIYWVCLLGLCAAYIQGGLVKATDFNGAVAELAHFGLPPSSWLALGTIFTELVGSILILSNFYRWLGAFLPLALHSQQRLSPTASGKFRFQIDSWSKTLFLNIWAWSAAFFSLLGTTFGTDIKVHKDSSLLQDRRT